MSAPSLQRTSSGGRAKKLPVETASREGNCARLNLKSADRTGMSEVTPEPRTAVMILVDASWEDQSGTPVAARVRMENKSASGACLRTKRRIAPGTKVRVQWRRKDFSGVVKYCEYESGDYRMGIRREAAAQKHEEQLETRKAEAPRKVDTPVREAPGRQQAAVVRTIPIAASVVKSRVKDAAVAELEQCLGVLAQPEKVTARQKTEVPAAECSAGKEALKERKTMGSKLLQLAHWRKKDEAVHGNGSAGNGAGNSASQNGSGKNGAHLGVASALVEKSAAEAKSAEAAEQIQVELRPMEDIYRAAGIVNPRPGYSVTKVVEMLKSEHLRGLSKEKKRASVLMALDAAGVSMDEVLRDAKVRQEAIDAYEAEQRKQSEALWAQKAEENMQINAELERVKASNAERIKRNQDGVARAKVTFVGWLTTKQQEAHGINEAVELCAKPVTEEPVGGNLPAVNVAGVNTKVV